MKINMPKTTVVDHWQILRINPQKLKADADNLHQAAQLVAMAGKYFIPEQMMSPVSEIGVPFYSSKNSS